MLNGKCLYIRHQAKPIQSNGWGWQAKKSRTTIDFNLHYQTNSWWYGGCSDTECDSDPLDDDWRCELDPDCSEGPEIHPPPGGDFGDWYVPPPPSIPPPPISGGGGGGGDSDDDSEPLESCLMPPPSTRIIRTPSPVYGGSGKRWDGGSGKRWDGGGFYSEHFHEAPIEILRLPQSTQATSPLDLLNLPNRYAVQSTSDDCDIKNKRCYYENMATLEYCVGNAHNIHSKELKNCKNGTYSGKIKFELGISIAKGIGDAEFSWVAKR